MKDRENGKQGLRQSGWIPQGRRELSSGNTSGDSRCERTWTDASVNVPMYKHTPNGKNGIDSKTLDTSSKESPTPATRISSIPQTAVDRPGGYDFIQMPLDLLREADAYPGERDDSRSVIIQSPTCKTNSMQNPDILEGFLVGVAR